MNDCNCKNGRKKIRLKIRLMLRVEVYECKGNLKGLFWI